MAAFHAPAAAALPTAEDRRRHELLVKTIFDWMNRTKATQQKLVNCISEFWRHRGEPDYRCDHTLLSRILHPDNPHVPTPRRRQSMKILQAAMVICANTDDTNIIVQSCDGEHTWADDDDQWFKVHRARLRALREQKGGSLFRSITVVGELIAAAAGMKDVPIAADGGESHRVRACENTLMTLATIVEPGPALTRLADRLAAEGVEPAAAVELELAQVRRIERLLEASANPTVNVRAYAGAALFHCNQQERGMQTLLAAVADCRDAALRHDPHWETLLELLDRVLERQLPDAERWSRQAQQLAAGAAGGAATLLRQAWTAVYAPRVREHWLRLSPATVKALDPAVPSLTLPTVRHAAVALMLSLAAVLMLAAPAADEAATLIGDSTDTASLAIRGREASGPNPPPSMPGNGGGRTA